MSKKAIVAVIGRPNVGKSSLLNALLGYERAIVSPLAGTTRDTVSEGVTLGGKLFYLTDTAGLRDGCDEIERLGIERTKKAAETADLLLIVLDSSQELTPDDEDVLALEHERKIVVWNKIDTSTCRGELCSPDCDVRVSALNGNGIDDLVNAMLAVFDDNSVPSDGVLLTNARQADSVRRCATAVDSARNALEHSTPDAVVYELETALDALRQLTGKDVQSSIVDEIFGQFCVGK